MNGLTETTNPANEPLGLGETKEYIGVFHDEEDALITALIVAARGICEVKTGRAFIERNFKQFLDEWPEGDTIDFARPVKTTTGGIALKYNASSGGSALTVGSTSYVLDSASVINRLTLKNSQSWPTLELRRTNAVELTFTGGYGSEGDVPEQVRIAMLLLVDHWYRNRGAVVVGTITKVIEFAVDSLLATVTVPHVA